MVNELNKFKFWFEYCLVIGPIPIKEKVITLPKNNYQMVINVCDFSPFEYSTELFKSSTMYFWFPISEMKKDAGINSIYAALHSLYYAYKNDLNVYLHCWSGRNRSRLVAACFYWMMTGEDQYAPTFGARNNFDNDDASKKQYSNRLHYNCERGIIPSENQMKEFLTFLKHTWENGYTETKIGLMDYAKKNIFPDF